MQVSKQIDVDYHLDKKGIITGYLTLALSE